MTHPQYLTRVGAARAAYDLISSEAQKKNINLVGAVSAKMIQLEKLGSAPYRGNDREMEEKVRRMLSEMRSNGLQPDGDLVWCCVNGVRLNTAEEQSFREAVHNIEVASDREQSLFSGGGRPR